MSTPDIVLGGLGGDGPIVTGGLGLTGAPDPNAMRATLRGTGALYATLSAAGDGSMEATLTGSSTLTAALTAAGGAGGVVWSIPVARPASVAGEIAHIAATLTGTSTLTATLTGVDRDLEAALLLLDLELTFMQGVTL